MNEDVSPIKKGDFPAIQVNLQESSGIKEWILSTSVKTIRIFFTKHQLNKDVHNLTS